MRLLSCVFAALFATGASAAPAFDPKPWLADLDEMRAALSTRYANLEWLVVDRGADLNEYFARAKRRIERAQDAGTARNAFDLLVRRIGDGHIDIDWPQPPGPPSAAVAPVDPCASAGYDATKLGAPLAALMPGYEALGGEPFPAGIIRVGARRVGILKIGLFSAEGMPELCRSARQALGIAPGAPCDDDCQGRIDKAAEERMNDGFIATLEALKAARPDALLVDVTGNGGGSEWVEAVARMLTPKRLKSGRIGFLRGAQWSKELADAESDLREAAKTASPGDRAFLLGLADAAKAKRAVAQTPCDAAPLWRGERPACTWLGEGFYASGLVDSADPKTLEGKPWAARVFTPMEHPIAKGSGRDRCSSWSTRRPGRRPRSSRPCCRTTAPRPSSARSRAARVAAIPTARSP